MSTLQTLIDAGAEIVAGTVNLAHVEMGRLRDGDLHLSDEGRAKLDELAEKPATPAPKSDAKTAPAKTAPAKKPPAKKAAKGTDIAPEPAVDAQTVADDMVNDLDLGDLDQDE